MRSSLPIFIFIGLALLAVIGVTILGAAATSAAAEVNDTAKDDLALSIYSSEFYIVFGISAVLLLVGGYFALKTML